MKNKKLTGSFYTPKVIADFIVDYLSTKLKSKSTISILEPSVGDGVFIHSIFNHSDLSFKVKEIVAIERDKKELEKISFKKPKFNGIHSDFLEYQKDNISKYNLVIGNPPYIKKNLLEPYQIELCKEIHSNASLAKIQPKNIWTAFLVRCINFLEDDGVIGFVLPSELLQVKFAAELRQLIIKEFERVEIFTFNELLFDDCKGQDTLLLIGEKKASDKGVFYCNIEKLSELATRNFRLGLNINIKESKWTHHHLTGEESELLAKLKANLDSVNNYCSSKAGIVTAANDYFIVDKKTVQKYNLEEFVKPIIKRALFVNGSVVLSEKEFQSIINDSKPAYLLSLADYSQICKNEKLLEYLEIGEGRQIHKRYKTSARANWFEVPNIGTPPEAFFFKRCYDYPKFIKNSASVFSTDSAYVINMKEDYKVDQLIFSFYNSLTLSFAELYGRSYGGGVLELTPNEFKTLPVPFIDNSSFNFEEFNNDFKTKSSIRDILLKNDIKILKTINKGIDIHTIEKIRQIREKLHQYRIRISK